MPKLAWSGPDAPSDVVRALKSAGITLAREGEATIVSTKDGKRAPPKPERGPWLWVSAKAIDDGAARDAVLAGAYDAIVLSETKSVERLVARVQELAIPDPAPVPPATAVVHSAVAKKVLAQVARAARTSMPVLITGETGTGKEVTARLLHTWSARRERAFVPINCAAIPNELMEGELFGYAKGAFSGAVRSYDGTLMSASGGTVFLDEIDDTPQSIQVKLLRVLEDRVVTRLGETASHQVDFRILAATNRDLKKLIAAGQFGDDLYERLAIVHVHLPPLRERLDDLPALAEFFMRRFFKEEPDAQGRPAVTRVSPTALRALAAYPWPGNIRELRNVIFEALVYKRGGDELLLSDLPKRVLQRGESSKGDGLVDGARLRRMIDDGALNLRNEVEALERAALVEALARAAGNASAAARMLGEVGRGSARDPGGTVRAMMRRLGVSGPRE